MAEPHPRETEALSTPPKAPRVWPLQHFRLSLFFVAVAALGVALGILRLRRLEAPSPPGAVEWILVTSVAFTALLGFLGVLVHRLRILPLRWRETERYLKAIQRESQKYRALMEGAADMLLVVEPETGRLLEWNTRAREELGLPATSDGSLSIGSVVLDEDRPRLASALRDAAGAPGPAVSISELRLRARHGQTHIAEGRLAAIALPDEQVVQVSLRDLTRQKEMEQQLQIHERLSSIGMLTAGVAHEINNPLEGIGNYLRLLERENTDAATRKRHFEQVHHGFSRIREIVRELLSFARPPRGEGQADLSAVVERARRLAAFADRFRGVEVSVAGLDLPLLVVGDAGRLEQVVFNLLLNAATAMQARGRISIRARRVSDERGSSQVELLMEDEGPGIPPANLERVFDPFFTTTQGSGLGLSVSYGIVRAHGGTLTAENRAEGGARFVIRLPWYGPATGRT